MMKKNICNLLAIILLSVTLTSCAQSEKPASAVDSSTSNRTESGSSESDDTTSGDVIVLKIAHVDNDTSPYQVGLERYAEELSRLTNGKVTGKVYSGSILGNDRELTEGMALGTTDIGVASSAMLESFIPDMAVLNAPFMFNSPEHAAKMIDGEVGEHFEKELESLDFHTIGWMSSGMRNVFSTRPIQTVDDFKNLKIRTMQNNMHMRTFELLGAQAVPMDTNEQFTALQQGTIDANENATCNALNQHYYEVIKHITNTGHVFGFIAVGISTKTLESIPEEYRSAIFEAGKVMEEVERSQLEADNVQAEEELKKLGVTFYEIDREALKEKIAPVYEEFSANMPEDLLKKVRDLA
ncbi:TRAP transporter substrate-binding protein [Marasmitruncus massiliensis]|uniref:TRAP transporter substrate-binding protein n=1 Tax=Marasmitruncus massiliensis TaxID=1944642 RepID=UPI000C7C826F|nr:TRAP transporter substrate-binding protein [Marasmitruncus massiliensis]